MARAWGTRTQAEIEMDESLRRVEGMLAEVEEAIGDDGEDLRPSRFDEKEFEGLTIRLKGNKFVKFRLRGAQKKILRDINKQLEMGVPVFEILLKARQFGGSTFYLAILYLLVRDYGYRVGIMAQSLDAANTLWKIFRVFYSKDDGGEKPKIVKMGTREWQFDNNGEVWVGSSGAGSSRSRTFNAVHISELPQWEGDVNEQLLGFLNTLAEGPGSFAFIESTAKGFEEFERRWRMAVGGKDDYVPIFVGWLECEEYSKAFSGPLQREEFIRSMDDEERIMASDLGAAPEQLYWRRWCIANKCGGSRENFWQEYPATPEQAFLKSGRPVFSQQRIGAWMRTKKAPEFVGEMVYRNADEVAKAREDEAIRGTIFKRHPGGTMTIFEWPVPYKDYEIGADVSEGIVCNRVKDRDSVRSKDTDDSALTILRRDTAEQVAVWRGKIHPEEFSDMLACLGVFFNNAYICVEANNHGMQTVTRLSRQYIGERVYKMIRGVDEGLPERTFRLGFYTSDTSKQWIINNLAVAIRADDITLNDEATLRELSECTYDDNGRVRTTGKDAVSAICLAWEAHLTASNYNKTPITKTSYDLYRDAKKKHMEEARRQQWSLDLLAAG